ncbi:putative alpha-L-glutamate ligase [Dissostichus eleginoides]|uniref:Alpha-L-glutamate ligase n=1 Tax=Dissostichus eleginoides TaxID=100907 RepID=A0AAD9FP01_DISEL|nr:putative alpha-L-glutamate ligase [Dissostichus eleginoides]
MVREGLVQPTGGGTAEVRSRREAGGVRSGPICGEVRRSRKGPFRSDLRRGEEEEQEGSVPVRSAARFGSRDCGFEIEQAELDAVPETNLSIAPCGDQNMQEYLDFAMERNDLQKPENWETASELYMKLKEYAQL